MADEIDKPSAELATGRVASGALALRSAAGVAPAGGGGPGGGLPPMVGFLVGLASTLGAMQNSLERVAAGVEKLVEAQAGGKGGPGGAPAPAPPAGDKPPGDPRPRWVQSAGQRLSDSVGRAASRFGGAGVGRAAKQFAQKGFDRLTKNVTGSSPLGVAKSLFKTGAKASGEGIGGAARAAGAGARAAASAGGAAGTAGAGAAAAGAAGAAGGAGAAGAAAGGGAAVAGGAALASNPVGWAIAAALVAVTALKLFADAVVNAGQEQQRHNFLLAESSARMAQVQATDQQRGMLRDMEKGDRIAAGARALSNSNNRLGDGTKEFEILFDRIQNGVLAKLVDSVAQGVELVAPLAEWANRQLGTPVEAPMATFDALAKQSSADEAAARKRADRFFERPDFSGRD